MQKANVALVVVNWNGIAETRGCLQSIRGLEWGPLRTCVVDNGSDDDEAGVLEHEFPEVTVLRMSENAGYPAACNRGIAWAADEGFSYACILNNDINLAPDFLTRLMDFASSRDEAPAFYAPLILRSRDQLVWSAGGRLRWPWVAGEHLGEGSDPESYFDPFEVDWASGCALLFPMSLIEQIGPMDGSLFLYLDDIEWCLRARSHGIPTWVVPAARLQHEVTKTTSAMGGHITRYYAYRNFYIVGFRYGSPLWRAWFTGHYLLTMAKIAVRNLLSPSYRRDRLYNARTRGLIDFALGKRGKGPYVHQVSRAPRAALRPEGEG